ncbi:MAG: hypothetical protein IKB62_03955 [Oscillospiraceae bacterium]|nr:hypothetical protein [Oscillospiraceae bacterium]
MKKLIWLLMVCILFLCGCSGRQGVSGQVTGYAETEISEYPVIMIKQENGREYGIVIDSNTFMHSWIEDEEESIEKLKSGTAEDISVSAFSKSRLRSIKTDKGDVKALIADTVSVDSLLRKEMKTLSDGTVLDILETGSSITYQMSDGTELLRVNNPIGPDNVYVGNRESFDSFSEEARLKVLEYYDSRGLLYDEETILEQAYRHYCTDRTEFHTYLLEQVVSPAASNDEIMTFLTSVTIPLASGQVGHEIRLGEIFDKQTGEHISGYDIFNCEKEKAVDIIVDAAFDYGATHYSESVNGDVRLKDELKAAMKPEYIILWNENLEIAFPAGTLESFEHCFLVGIEYTDEIKSIMHPWAVPDTAW